MQVVNLWGKVFYAKVNDGKYGQWIQVGMDVGEKAGIFLSINNPHKSLLNVRKGDCLVALGGTVSARERGETKSLTNEFRCGGTAVRRLDIENLQGGSDCHFIGKVIGEKEGKFLIEVLGRKNPKTNEIAKHKVIVKGSGVKHDQLVYVHARVIGDAKNAEIVAELVCPVGK